MRVCLPAVFFTMIGISVLSPMSMGPLAASQADPVSLTVEIVSGRIADADSDSVRLTLELRFVLKNDGTRPVLLLKRNPELVERELIDYSDPPKRLARVATYRSIERSREWRTLRQRLNRLSVPTNVIRILEPGETFTWETNDWFHLSKSNGPNVSNKSWKKILAASPVKLLLTVELWPKNLEPYSAKGELSFGKSLQHRWRKKGYLMLTTLTSQPIHFDLSTLSTTE